MSLTQRQIAGLKASASKQNYGCGNGLKITIESEKKGGQKYFVGSMNIYPNGKRKQVDVRIGKYGKDAGCYSLESAMKEWLSIKEWASEKRCDPRQYYHLKLNAKKGRNETKTIKNAIDLYLEDVSRRVKPSTAQEYRLKLHNTVLPLITPDSLISDLEWENGGREVVMNTLAEIEGGVKFDLAHRCRTLLLAVFDTAISQGWMRKGQNPAERLVTEKNTHIASHHPSLDWSEVPAFLDALSLNKSDANQLAILSLKLLLLTGLRAGTLVRLEWNWIEDDMFVIPANTPGLKRTRNHLDKPHHLPITDEIKTILDRLRKLNPPCKYLFPPLRESRYDFLDPSTPNNVLRNLGYKDRLRAHGWRSVFLTAGREVLGVPEEIIRKQMGHLPEGKVLQAYDTTLFLDQRRQFLQDWGMLLVKSGLQI